MAEFYRRGDLPGALMEKWPRDERGEPVRPAFLAFRSSTDLDAYGIPAMILHPGDGDFGKVILGISGTGSRIYVPETMLDDAKALMEAETDDELQSGI